ncbi:MAG TPA: ATP-binding protein [Dictyobacter sp.]|jgi:PAS domain S-box-containing protein|nr:ATP-binding protein [Dictyobacter sp.]
MEVEQSYEQINISDILTTLLNDFSAITDYRTLRDSLPRRLANALQCRCVLLYLRIDETLQLASGSFDDMPGWSSALLAVAHVNPIALQSDLPEARAWRERRVIGVPAGIPTLLALPLIYRQRGIGVLVVIRGHDAARTSFPVHWYEDASTLLEPVAGVVALLLENTRLLERDRERIHELSLLNSMSNQMTSSSYEMERLRSIVLRRTREISRVDLCDLLDPAAAADAIPWLHPTLRDQLLQRFHDQHSSTPVIIERFCEGYNEYVHEYFTHLPETVKTFFVLPLISGRSTGLRTNLHMPREVAQIPRVLGCIVGAYYRPWKIRHAEIALLQVLATQASAVLENMRLMEEVVDARNQARMLLRQVLDDQQFKELILESIPSGLITTDQHGCIHTFNRAAEVILGYHVYEVLGQPLQKYLDLGDEQGRGDTPAVDVAEQEPVLVALHDGEPQQRTVAIMDRYDREVILDIDVRPLYDDGDQQIGTLLTFTDMTLMHRLEEEKRRLDHLASLGEMAASVAHEVRNPLASIKTSIQMLQDDLLDDAISVSDAQRLDEERRWMQESVSVVLKEVDRLDTIVRDLLLFARPHQLKRMQCDIVCLVEHVLGMIQPQSNASHVDINRVYESLPPIWVDEGQIEQVLLNLCLNAVQAMTDGGILTISCHCISTEEAIYDTAGTSCPPTQKPSGSSGTALSAYAWLIDKHATQREFRVDQWLEIIVSDTGVGMTPEQIKHIFQPFYTTKAHGIGLGLAITRRLVEDHGGYLRIESQFGCGAAMSVRLPYVTEINAHY